MPKQGKSETSTPESCRPPIAQGDLEHYKEAAIALVQRCVRNTQLEDLHAGIFPASQSGDYDDVKVISPYGETIPQTARRIARAKAAGPDSDTHRRFGAEDPGAGAPATESSRSMITISVGRLRALAIALALVAGKYSALRRGRFCVLMSGCGFCPELDACPPGTFDH